MNKSTNFTTTAFLALTTLGLAFATPAQAETTAKPVQTAYRSQETQIFTPTQTTPTDQQAKAQGLINMLKASQGEAFHQQVIHMLGSVEAEALAELKIMYGQKEWQTLAIATLEKMQTPAAQKLLQALSNNAMLAASTSGDSPNTTALMQLAASQTETFNYKEAIQTYSQVIEIDPTNAKAHGNRGILRLHIGEQQAAVNDFQHSAKLYQTSGNMAQYAMAMNYVRTVKTQMANLNGPTQTSLAQE